MEEVYIELVEPPAEEAPEYIIESAADDDAIIEVIEEEIQYVQEEEVYGSSEEDASQPYTIEEIAPPQPPPTKRSRFNNPNPEFDHEVAEVQEMMDQKRHERLAKDAAAKRERIANETAEQRQARLEGKREINRRYFDNETPEQKQMRLLKKAQREKRARLDSQLQSIHPDLLATKGIEVVRFPTGMVEMRVPWEVPEDETEAEQETRYRYQEQVIQELIAQETPDMTQLRQHQYRVMNQRPVKPRRQETEEQRVLRLERAKEQTRLRRLRETPDQRVQRLQEQRLRTQRNREARSYEAVVRMVQERKRNEARNKVQQQQNQVQHLQPLEILEYVDVEEQYEDVTD